MKTVLKILGVILIGIGVIILLAGMSAASDALGMIILLLMGGIPAALGMLCLLKSKKKPNQPGSNVPDQPTAPPMPDPKPVEPDPIIEEQPADVTAAPKIKSKYFGFNVAGVHYRKNDIVDLLDENDDYEMTKKDIIGSGMDGEYIYKYSIKDSDAELIPEPDNKHDKNAIMVMVDGTLIGYVPKDKIEKTKSILDSKHIDSIRCSIYGGDYKVVYDDSPIKKGSTDLKAEISIKYH